MDRKLVSSSELSSVGYDGDSQLLEVEFRVGTIYQYHNVPADVHAALLKASSIGRFFNEHIIGAGYPFVRLR